jgi:outer membrane protein assembly factor BamA
MDTGTGMAPGIKKVIYTRTRDTRIRVPGGFSVPVSNTRSEGSRHRTSVSLSVREDKVDNYILPRHRTSVLVNDVS